MCVAWICSALAGYVTWAGYVCARRNRWKSSETRYTEARRDEETGQANRGELAVMQGILCWFGLPSRIEDRNKCAYQ